jgi:hypothetical protein
VESLFVISSRILVVLLLRGVSYCRKSRKKELYYFVTLDNGVDEKQWHTHCILAKKRGFASLHYYYYHYFFWRILRNKNPRRNRITYSVVEVESLSLWYGRTYLYYK